MNLSLIIKIIVSIILCLGLGFLSGFSSADVINTWYADLNKPFFNPPNWLFGPAWTVLYIMIGIAFAYVWDDETDDGLKSKAIKFFLIQFVLNLLWTPVFFMLKQPLAALFIIVLLLAMIILTMKAFKNVDNRPFYLMIPYFLWVCFATLLNASIVYLN